MPTKTNESSNSKKNSILNKLSNLTKSKKTTKSTTDKKTKSTKKSVNKETKSKSTKKAVDQEAKVIIKPEITKVEKESSQKKLGIKSSKTTSVKNTKKSPSKKTTKSTIKKTSQPVNILEYYDLPYRYNETIVKILYQTPNTLFVYWDISDKDRENYIKQYGENFFNITHPVLVIHNDTLNYSFEIEINDFANSWYLNVADSKCNYRVELGRRPNYDDITAKEDIQEKIDTDYIYVSSSNEIELPNDHVLFTTNENNTIKYRNVKTSEENNVPLYDIIKDLPVLEKSEIPYISSEILEGLYSAIYKNEDVSFFERLSNPSSGNLSSSKMPHSNMS